MERSHPMADANDTPSTPSAACENAPGHPTGAQAKRPDAAAAPLFGRGEIDHIVRRCHEDGGDPLSCAWNLAEADCISLDGIAAKLEWLLQRQIRNLKPATIGRRGCTWEVIEMTAVMSSVLDLHRIIRCHAG